MQPNIFLIGFLKISSTNLFGYYFFACKMGISGLKFLLFRMFWVRIIRMYEFLLSLFFSHWFLKSADKGQSNQSYSFSSTHVWMWELDYKESWALKNWCFWTVVLEKTLESPLDCKEIKPINPKGNHFWIFTGRTDAEAETPILWPPDGKNWLIGKDPDAGKDWGRRRRGQQRMRWLDASPTWWTWVWVNSRNWWWTGRPGVLQSMGSQKVGHDWATELRWKQF